MQATLKPAHSRLQTVRIGSQSPVSVKHTAKYGAAGRITGIDLGSSAAKFVASHWHKSRCWVTHAHCLRWSKSVYDDVDVLATTLIDWLEEYGNPHARDIALSFPAVLVDQESVEIPVELRDGSLSNSTLASFAGETLRELLGAAANNAIYDGWVSTDGSSKKLHLVWTDREYARKLTTQLSKSGWFCRSIDASPVAQARAANFNSQNNSSQLVIDLNGTTASFIWSTNGVAQYYRRQIPLGASTPAEQIASQFNIRPIEAEVLLETIGIRTDEKKSDQCLAERFSQSLNDYLSALVYEIGRTRQYLVRLQADRPPQEIVLCGGASCIQGLAQWFNAQLDIDVRVATKPEHWEWQAALPYSAQFALATSLARPEVYS